MLQYFTSQCKTYKECNAKHTMQNTKNRYAFILVKGQTRAHGSVSVGINVRSVSKYILHYRENQLLKWCVGDQLEFILFN